MLRKSGVCMKKFDIPLKFTFVLMLAITLLVSCGKTGSQGQKPTSPSLNLEYQAIKTLAFNWIDVQGETEYKLLEDADGTGSFVEIANLPAETQSYALEVFLPTKVNAHYKLEACSAGGCASSSTVAVEVSQLKKAIGYFKASNTDDKDLFGYVVAVSADGQTVAVSAPYEDGSVSGGENDNSNLSSGAVYVFTRTTSGWTQQAYIKASNAGANDMFGWSLALSDSGDTLAVGAYKEDSNATGVNGNQNHDIATDSGAVYVFTRSGGNWTQQAYIKASNTANADNFGRSLALSGNGDTLIVGAPNTDDGGSNTGSAYVFTRNSGNWSQQAYLKASNAGVDDRFGWAVAISADGGTLAAGAHSEDSSATGINGNQSDNSKTDSGAVYVFTKTSGNWNQQAYLKASNTGAGDEFGKALALSANGNVLIVGAPQEDSNSTGINGDEGNNQAADSGAVYVFARSSGNWAQQAYVKASNTGAGDLFGTSVTVTADGRTMAASASGEDSKSSGINGDQTDDSYPDSGAAYIFVYSPDSSTWNQQAYLKEPNTDSYDGLGYSIAISANSEILAAGAPLENSRATGVGGDQEDNSGYWNGAVFIY